MSELLLLMSDVDRPGRVKPATSGALDVLTAGGGTRKRGLADRAGLVDVLRARSGLEMSAWSILA